MKRTYEKYDSWKGFQPYFPEEYRINKDNIPDEYYWEWEDYSVHIDRYQAKGKKKSIRIILIHGGGGNGRLLSPLGVAFSSKGYECIAPDMPGFGLTEIRKPNSYYTWIELLNDLIDDDYKKNSKPIVLCGVSLGGMLSYQVACRNINVKGLMVSSLADTREKKIQIQLAKNKMIGYPSKHFLNAFKSISDQIKIPLKLTTKMWAMANNPSFVRELKNDKVGSGGWVYLKFLRTLLDAGPDVEPEDFNQCQLLFFQPDEDNIIPWEISEPFYNILACDKRVVFLKGCGHIPLEEPGIDQLRDAAIQFIDMIEKNESIIN